MTTQKKRNALRSIDLLNIAGYFLFILSVVGLVASLVTPDIGFAKSLGFSVSVAGVWCGGWLLALRVPPIALSICWTAAGAMVWFVNY